MTDKWELLEELRPQLNDIGVVADTQIGRLVGLGEDDEGLCYILRLVGGVERRCSVSAPFMSLRYSFPPHSYETLNFIFALNGAPPSDIFIEDILETFSPEPFHGYH